MGIRRRKSRAHPSDTYLASTLFVNQGSLALSLQISLRLFLISVYCTILVSAPSIGICHEALHSVRCLAHEVV
jgi:hypothetical protein